MEAHNGRLVARHVPSCSYTIGIGELHFKVHGPPSREVRHARLYGLHDGILLVPWPSSSRGVRT